MGIYLASPNREKTSEDGKSGNMRYGASGMQGITFQPLLAVITYPIRSLP